MIEKIIKGETEDDIWQQITASLNIQPERYEYNATIEHNNHTIVLDIDMDPGGGFESTVSSTSFVTLLSFIPSFRFAIHPEHFIDEIGKFFGMEDVSIGYQEFDKKLIIKTDNKPLLRKLFASSDVRETFQSISDFAFSIHLNSSNGDTKAYLELFIDEAITDIDHLRKLYNAFYNILDLLERSSV